MDYFSFITIALAILIGTTNVIVQVFKPATWDKIPTNLLAIVVALIVTVASGVAFLQIKGIAIVWWMIAALVLLGVFVAYGAMYGFDKVKELLDQWKKLLDTKR